MDDARDDLVSVTEPPAASVVDRPRRIVNVPNLLSGLRLAGTPFLVGMALSGNSTAFLYLFIFLVVTDWFDGKLAIALNQRTAFGARLDSIADGTLYATLIFGLYWLQWDFLLSHANWIAGALSSFALSVFASLIKFQRLPSYHTWGAKISWHLLNLAVVFLFGDWGVWPFYLMICSVILANLEATGITLILPTCQVDVRSLRHARRLANTQSNSDA